MATVAFVNFLGDPSQKRHMKQEDIARKIGVSPATLASKLKAVRDALDAERMDPRFSTRGMIDDNPMIWLLKVNGLIMDIRTAPREAQEEALRKGLIPHIPEPE